MFHVHVCNSTSGGNAFALNLAVAAVIKHASALSFVLAGVVKDVAIVRAF